MLASLKSSSSVNEASSCSYSPALDSASCEVRRSRALGEIESQGHWPLMGCGEQEKHDLDHRQMPKAGGGEGRQKM